MFCIREKNRTRPWKGLHFMLRLLLVFSISPIKISLAISDSDIARAKAKTLNESVLVTAGQNYATKNKLGIACVDEIVHASDSANAIAEKFADAQAKNVDFKTAIRIANALAQSYDAKKYQQLVQQGIASYNNRNYNQQVYQELFSLPLICNSIFYTSIPIQQLYQASLNGAMSGSFTAVVNEVKDSPQFKLETFLRAVAIMPLEDALLVSKREDTRIELIEKLVKQFDVQSAILMSYSNLIDSNAKGSSAVVTSRDIPAKQVPSAGSSAPTANSATCPTVGCIVRNGT